MTERFAAGSGAVSRTWLLVAAVVALVLAAAFFRFRYLGYSEFQGDEARAALMAQALLQGRGVETLMWHKKGPLEVLAPALMMVAGDVSEGTARLPFAIAGLLAVLIAFDLGRRLWGFAAGWIAALVLAIDGYLIAFSRIVQYQSFVVAAGLGAVWLALVWYQAQRRRDVLLVCSGLLVGVGTLAHYEMILSLPPIAWLVFSRGRAGRWPPAEWLRVCGPPVASLVVVAGSFYVPFVMHPHFAATAEYIGGRRIGGGLYNKLGDYFYRASFYNASYYVIALAVTLSAAVCVRLREALGRWGVAGVATWLALFSVLVLSPGLFEAGGQSWAILAFVPVVAAIVLSTRVDARWQAVLLWFAGPLLVAGFLVQKPHTHFYTMMPAAALLVGWTVARVYEWVGRRFGRVGRAGAATLGTLLFLVFAIHQYVVFIRHDPEYKRVYPEARLPGYWVPFGDELPRGGYFGFPYRAGWNEIRGLFLDGTLPGDYDSNEEKLITGWYTWGAVRCSETPRHYLVSWRPQDEENIPLDAIAKEYELAAVVTVNGKEKIRAWDRDGAAPGPVELDDSGSLVSVGGPATPFVHRPLAVSQSLEMPLPMRRFGAALESGIELVGADLPGAGPAASDAAAILRLPSRGPIGVVLVWSAAAEPDRNYSVFVHLVDSAGQTVAQSDGWPDCGDAPTSTWAPGAFIYDGHVVRVPGSIGPGSYELRVGMYEPESGRRLQVVDGGAATTHPDAIVVAQCEIGGQ